MKEFYEEFGYKQWIDSNGKLSCTCPDFGFRRLKKEKINKDDAVYKVKQNGLCKHLSWIILWELHTGKKELFANSMITSARTAEALARIKDMISKSSRYTK